MEVAGSVGLPLLFCSILGANMRSAETHPSPETIDDRALPQRWPALALLATAQLLSMSLWFSGAAVLPQIRAEWSLGESTAGWLTIAVQLGFVVGTLISAFLNLPDILSPKYLVAGSAFLGAASNGAFGYFAEGPRLGILLRFLTGMFLAGVYPPGMKILATWFRRSRGLALGVLVGALTLGKASSYLINGIGSANWRTNMLVISLLAVGGGLVTFLFVENGPFGLALAPFDWRQVLEVFKNRGVRLASFGYFGHMWELYAMWIWAPVMIRASLGQGSQPALAEVASFLVIGCGAIGCVVAGLVADRVGRTIVTSVAMAISGSCCLLIGFLFGGSPVLILIVAAIWGASVVADSAQFSTCVTELGNQQYLGTALTIQTCIGFLLTSISIELVPVFLKAAGWRYAFMILAPGPLLGLMAMLRLRSLPEAAKIAHGKR
jgi:MFS family permease